MAATIVRVAMHPRWKIKTFIFCISEIASDIGVATSPLHKTHEQVLGIKEFIFIFFC